MLPFPSGSPALPRQRMLGNSAGFRVPVHQNLSAGHRGGALVWFHDAGFGAFGGRPFATSLEQTPCPPLKAGPIAGTSRRSGVPKHCKNARPSLDTHPKQIQPSPTVSGREEWTSQGQCVVSNALSNVSFRWAESSLRPPVQDFIIYGLETSRTL